MARRVQRAPLEVWKFGGASLADAAAMRHAAALIKNHDGPLVVVASALGGVTDLLLEGARRASLGDAAAGAAAAADFERRHRHLIQTLVPPGKARQKLLADLQASSREYAELVRAVGALAEMSPRASDALLARGERQSSALLAAVLGASGRKAAQVDAALFLITDGHHGGATADLEATRIAARALFRPLLAKGVTAVVPGFIGRTPDGSVATLGRGGSDLTATVLARCLGAARAVLWKDVPGILTADPKCVPDARLVPQLHQREAAEVAYFGAKVLHPRALIPLERTRIALVVRSFVHPDRPGTEVSARHTLKGYPVKALATIRSQALVTVAGKGMMGVPGIAARTFTAVHEAGLSVSTIFQASSESSIGFTLPQAESARAVAALRKAFRDELHAGLIDGITERSGLAVVAVVGDGMAGTPGIASRVFSALSAGGVNVVAIAQGSSELNISFVVDEADVAEAARRVHAAFQLSKIGGGREPGAPRTDVVLLGFGRVGRVLSDQIAQNPRELHVIGLIDRSGFVFEPRGFSRRRIQSLGREKDRGRSLKNLGGRAATAAEAVAFISSHAVSRPVLVDLTAGDTGGLLCQAVHRGFDLVLANKLPLAGSQESYVALHEAVRQAGRRIRYEATVGAGLPILDTFSKLVESGDRVLRVEGCVSGTLGFVLSSVCDGRPFSEAVLEAVERGYSEPDPREDLSGRDALRKGLILGRLLGYTHAQPAAEDLVPAAYRKLPLEGFLARVGELDGAWRDRVERARGKDKVLRYLVTATKDAVRAYLAEVPLASPAGSLKGTRNLISFTTRRYRHEPLVVMGPGAGPEVTAAGILNDVMFLAMT